jgi:spore coat protein A
MEQNELQRRTFIKTSLALTSTVVVGPALFWGTSAQAVPGNGKRPKPTVSLRPLIPSKIPKFFNLLPNPLDPVWLAQPDVVGGKSYTLTIRQVQQNLGLGNATTPANALTTVWGYGAGANPATYPGPTFDLLAGTTSGITVTFNNALSTYPLPIDLTLDWANPGSSGGTYPVPAVTHLHGGDTPSLSDGLPDAWSTPNDQIKGRLFSKPYNYDNLQEAGHLWYHDHALGITRTNVYMGLAGLYFLRDANENALRNANVLPSHPYEVPLVIQDRNFNIDGSLFYPVGSGKGLPPNSIVPEFFGDTLLVNTQAWPLLKVEPRKYRLRILNGSDSRFYELKLVDSKGRPGPGLLVIGNELGLLNQPVYAASANFPNGSTNVLAIGPGERYDVIVDFTGYLPNTRFILANLASSPYPAGARTITGLTDQVMAFDVSLPFNITRLNATVTPADLLRQPDAILPPVSNTNAVTVRRRLMLAEGTDKFGRIMPMLGTVDPVGALRGTLVFNDPVTETPMAGTSEIWEFYNTTVDAHPMHMHLVDFRIIDRQGFVGQITPKTNTDQSIGSTLDNIVLLGTPRPAYPWEAGKKDTVQCFPGEVARVLVNFKRPGEFVYHCHILSHEDHEMMRSYIVAPP